MAKNNLVKVLSIQTLSKLNISRPIWYRGGLVCSELLLDCSFAKTYCIRNNMVPRHDSNVKLLLRTELFYPLNYGGYSPDKLFRVGINLSGLFSWTLYLFSFVSVICSLGLREVFMNSFIAKQFRVTEPVSNFLFCLTYFSWCMDYIWYALTTSLAWA